MNVLLGVVPVFLLMAAGAAVRRLHILNQQADHTLLDLCVHVLLPCLILDHLISNDALRRTGNLLCSPLLGFLCTAGSLLAARLMAARWRWHEASQARTFTFVAGIYNYGYIPIPLIQNLYGADALAVLFLYNLGTETAFWTLGFSHFMERGPLRDWRRALTTPVRAIILGVTINLVTAAFGMKLDEATLGSASWGWPVQVLIATVHQIGLCSIPLAMLIIGATMADFWAEFRASRGAAVMALSIFVRNLAVPAAMVAVAWLLPVSRELKETLVVQAAMPAGVFTLLLTRHNGGSVPVALQVIFSTSAAAIVTLPLWVHFGMRWALEAPR